MEKLKYMKNHHFGMGLLIIAIQIVLQFSNAAYVFGIMLMSFSIYENWIFHKLNMGKEKIDNLSTILAQFKWVSTLLILSVNFISMKFMSDIGHKQGVLEMFYEDPIGWINIVGISFIFIHFSMETDIKRIEKELSR
jgi:hypothetical protein